MYGLDEGVTSEQKALIASKTFSLRPLASAGHLDLFSLLGLVWAPIVAFVATLFILISSVRLHNNTTVFAIWVIVVLVLTVTPTITVFVLTAGVVQARMKSRIKWPAVTYWMWWPFWKFVMIWVAVGLGSYIGNYIWNQCFLPYTNVARLQAYRNIIPESTSGVRLQDAGLIKFNDTVGVDRSRTGCLKNGATYCIAPIVTGGVLPSCTDSPGAHGYDLFMTGVDCCTCPGEFRCGAWDKPGTLGGYRVTTEDDRKFFRLAVQDWSSTYGKHYKHPVFFNWVSEPVQTWSNFSSRGYQLLTLALLLFPFAVLGTVIALNGILKFLHNADLATPRNAPMPPPGVTRDLGAQLAPQMHNFYNNEQAQQGSYLGPEQKYAML